MRQQFENNFYEKLGYELLPEFETLLNETETGAAEAIGVGLAVLDLIQSKPISGSFSIESNIVSYIHTGTKNKDFRTAILDFRLYAQVPAVGIGTRELWFRISYDYNGNDIRNASIMRLVDRSSNLYGGTFSIKFEGRELTHESEPVAKIVFIITGSWDPPGWGDVSFWGKLVINANGSVPLIFIDSEKEYVYFSQNDRFYPVNAPTYMPPFATATPIPSGPSPVTNLPATNPIVRKGSKGEAVKQLQRLLSRWATKNGQPYVIKDDGDFGRYTESAVKAFQRWSNMRSVDGIVGPATWAALKPFLT